MSVLTIYVAERGELVAKPESVLVMAGLSMNLSSSGSGIPFDWREDMLVQAEKELRAKHQKDECKKYRRLLELPEYRALVLEMTRNLPKFALVIRLPKELQESAPKAALDYLTMALRTGLSQWLSSLLRTNRINQHSFHLLRLKVESKTLSVNNQYDLTEGLSEDLKLGRPNKNWNHRQKPILPSLKSIDVEFCTFAELIGLRAAAVLGSMVYEMESGSALQNELSELTKIYFPARSLIRPKQQAWKTSLPERKSTWIERLHDPENPNPFS